MKDLLSNLMAWSNERFPLAHAPIFILFYLMPIIVARSLIDGEIKITILIDMMGAFVAWSLFLLMRILDEHKDYELDCVTHPERVLQSGRIHLNHLKIIAAAALLLQIGFTLYQAQTSLMVIIAWVIMMGWLSLMTKEFFVGTWLTRHLVIYALSHMAIMPLTIWWFIQLGHPGTQINFILIMLMVLSFISGFAGEIVRKTRGPEEEREGVDSYSKIFGTQGSAYVVIGLVLIMSILQFYILQLLTQHSFWLGYGIIIVGLLFAVFNIIKFIRQPSLKAREKNEMAVGIAMLLGYFAIIFAAINEKGITITFLMASL